MYFRAATCFRRGSNEALYVIKLFAHSPRRSNLRGAFLVRLMRLNVTRVLGLLRKIDWHIRTCKSVSIKDRTIGSIFHLWFQAGSNIDHLTPNVMPARRAGLVQRTIKINGAQAAQRTLTCSRVSRHQSRICYAIVASPARSMWTPRV